MSNTSVPRLNRQSFESVYQALLAYKSGERQGTVMNRLSRGYSDEDLKLIARVVAEP